MTDSSDTTATTEDRQAKADLAAAFYRPLGNGDTASLEAILAPDWEAIPALRTGGGPQGWQQSVEHLRGVFDELTSTVDAVAVDGDVVAVRTTTTGVHAGELLGVAGTGKRVEFRAADFHRIEDGRIVRSWHLEDYLGLATQLGLALS